MPKWTRLMSIIRNMSSYIVPGLDIAMLACMADIFDRSMLLSLRETSKIQR